MYLFGLQWDYARLSTRSGGDASLFSEEELMSMEEVVKYFEDTRTRQIIELSHEESGWVDNHEERELISYQKYGFQIKGVEA